MQSMLQDPFTSIVIRFKQFKYALSIRFKKWVICVSDNWIRNVEIRSFILVQMSIQFESPKKIRIRQEASLISPHNYRRSLCYMPSSLSYPLGIINVPLEAFIIGRRLCSTSSISPALIILGSTIWQCRISNLFNELGIIDQERAQ